jgi:RsiW-degrading membrane proteinase PrsW (M82 family)
VIAVKREIRQTLCYLGREAGTWLPVLAALVFVLGFNGSEDHQLTLTRMAAYLGAVVSLPLGIVALVRMMRRPHGGHPSFFLVMMFYKGIFVWLVFLASFGRVLFAEYPGYVPDNVAFGQPFVYALLVDAALSLSLLNLLLFASVFSVGYGLLQLECDPVPFRRAWKALRQRGRAGRDKE